MEERKRYILLFFAIVFFIAGFISEHILLDKEQAAFTVTRFEKKLHERQRFLDKKLDEIENTLITNTLDKDFQPEFHQLSSLFQDKGLGFLIADRSKYLFWSDNRFSFKGLLTEFQEKKVQFLPNGIYLSTTRKVRNFTVIGLILVKNRYQVENEYVSNTFPDYFGVPSNYQVRVLKTGPGYPVYDQNGDFLFSLVPTGKIFCEHTKLYLPVILFFLSLISLLIFIRAQFHYTYRHENVSFRMFALGFILFLIYWVHLVFRIPQICYSFDLFGPYLYASSFWLPSLGDLLILSAFIFLWSYCFSREFKFSKKKNKETLIGAYIFVSLFYFFINFLIEDMIRNSSFSFYLDRINDISIYSVAGYLVIALLLLSAAMINLKVLKSGAPYINKKKFMAVHAVLILLSATLSAVFENSYLYIVCLFLITGFSFFALQKYQLKPSSLSSLIYFVSLFTLFSLFIIQNHNNARRRHIQKLMAVTLYSENDPAAEVFLTEMQQQINVDSVIPYLLSPPYVSLQQYLTHQYFSGYFKKYDIQIITCDGSDSLRIQPENKLVPCFPFFDEMIGKTGNRIAGTNFYYMDNMNGRISYFGKLFYPLSSDSIGVSIFIELKSKLLPEGIGFPELLLDKSMKKPEQYNPFSYAKYYHSELVNLNGDYQYNYHIRTYNIRQDSTEFTFRKWDHYDHLIYSLGNDNYIIVSIKTFTFLDYLISFPYLFVFYFLIVLTVVFSGNPGYRKRMFINDLKFKIQASIITIVLLSLLVVAAGTIYYNVKAYTDKHQNDLNEKMKSISEEINMRLGDVDNFTPDVRTWLWNELSDLSNIFRTDINIYGSDGEMIVSSRPEIVNKGMMSSRMNEKAFYEMTENYQINYMQPEKIGKLDFLSVYEPIINNKGEYLGFINLPYFSRGDELRQEVSTFIVAFINLYVMLFFTSVIVAFLLANKITLPLSLVREKLKGIQLNKKNEQINYKQDDEIGALVREYNRKVAELDDSAKLLARSERELAWREMAKQIAHEIKNPLTPMKLNIQYLQRAKAEKSPHYDEFFDRVTRSLIEQIDTLSDIATEFSNFAKIPEVRNEVFELGERLRHVAALFDSNKQVDFYVEIDETQGVFICADKEQVSRAVVNLVKNAMQAIPPKKKGRVSLNLSQDEYSATIAVADNGTGIPENIRHKMFQPNFTTKTSGMGLGLAIVKKTVETFEGRIWFETKVGSGTTFFIRFPLFKG